MIGTGLGKMLLLAQRVGTLPLTIRILSARFANVPSDVVAAARSPGASACNRMVCWLAGSVLFLSSTAQALIFPAAAVASFILLLPGLLAFLLASLALRSELPSGSTLSPQETAIGVRRAASRSITIQGE